MKKQPSQESQPLQSLQHMVAHENAIVTRVTIVARMKNVIVHEKKQPSQESQPSRALQNMITHIKNTIISVTSVTNSGIATTTAPRFCPEDIDRELPRIDAILSMLEGNVVMGKTLRDEVQLPTYVLPRVSPVRQMLYTPAGVRSGLGIRCNMPIAA